MTNFIKRQKTELTRGGCFFSFRHLTSDSLVRNWHGKICAPYICSRIMASNRPKSNIHLNMLTPQSQVKQTLTANRFAVLACSLFPVILEKFNLHLPSIPSWKYIIPMQIQFCLRIYVWHC